MHGARGFPQLLHNQLMVGTHEPVLGVACGRSWSTRMLAAKVWVSFCLASNSSRGGECSVCS